MTNQTSFSASRRLAHQFETRIIGNSSLASRVAITTVNGEVHVTTVHQDAISKIAEIAALFPQVREVVTAAEGIVVKF